MDEEIKLYDEKKKSESKKENFIEKISDSSMRKIDGQISTQKIENCFSDRIKSREINLSDKIIESKEEDKKTSSS